MPTAWRLNNPSLMRFVALEPSSTDTYAFRYFIVAAAHLHHKPSSSPDHCESLTEARVAHVLFRSLFEDYDYYSRTQDLPRFTLEAWLLLLSIHRNTQPALDETSFISKSTVLYPAASLPEGQIAGPGPGEVSWISLSGSPRPLRAKTNSGAETPIPTLPALFC
jgi:hypothetical protein